MTTKEIREALTEKRAMYKASLEKSKEADKEIREILQQFDAETVNMISTVGVDINPVLHFDLDRMKTDTEYVESCQAQLQSCITQLHSFLESQV